MSKRTTHPPEIRACSESERREQALCIEALESGEFDGLTDEAWVQLCESVSKVEEERRKLAATLRESPSI
jgi:hypothetical protein